MDAIDGDILKFIYGEAMVDATNQKAFPHQGKDRLLAIDDPRELVYGYLAGILDGSHPDPKQAAMAVAETFEKAMVSTNVRFTFGNAQKLVNICAKYLYVVTLGRPGARELFSNCDCPIDVHMSSTVISEMGRLSSDADPATRKRAQEFLDARYGRNGETYRSIIRKPWSRITVLDTSQYDLFQESVRFLAGLQGLTPLEYDYRMWS